MAYGDKGIVVRSYLKKKGYESGTTNFGSAATKKAKKKRLKKFKTEDNYIKYQKKLLRKTKKQLAGLK